MDAVRRRDPAPGASPRTGALLAPPRAAPGVSNAAIARLVAGAAGPVPALAALSPLAGNAATARRLATRPVSRSLIQRDDPPAAPLAPLPPEAADAVGPRYAPMSLGLRRALARSVGALAELGTTPAADFNEYLDRLEAAHIATLVQVWGAATGLGFATHIDRFKHVYYGSSWGFEFYGNSGALQGLVQPDSLWCHDLQRFVRPEHGNTANDWWRHCAAPAGQRGLHIGLDAGAGYVNLHYDSQNPAEGRQTDSASSYLNPFVIGQMIGDAAVCNYDMGVVYTHNKDIHSTGGRNFPAPFAEIPRMRYVSNRINELVGYELGDPLGERTSTMVRQVSVTALRADLTTYDRESRDLAASPTGEADATRLGFTARAEALETRIIDQLRDLARFIDTTATSLGSPRSEQVSRGGTAAVGRVTGWPDVTTHLADDLAGSYFSLGEKRRLPAGGAPTP